VFSDALPTTILKLVTAYKARSLVQIESENLWLSTEINDTNLMNADPFKGPFTNITEVFDASVASPRVLIDQYILPQDNCLAIANAIQNHKARAITD